MVIAIDGMRVNNLCGSGPVQRVLQNDGRSKRSRSRPAPSPRKCRTALAHQQHAERRRQPLLRHLFPTAPAAVTGRQPTRRDDSGPTAIPQPGIAYTWQVNPSFGGPLKRDKLWFYLTYKYEDNKTYVASSAFADGTRAYRQAMGNYSGVGRVTWQASRRDKLRFYLEKQFNGEFYNGFNTLPTTTPEASTDAFGRGWVPQVKWTQVTSDKLLLEAGITYYNQPYEQNYTAAVGPLDLPRLEQTTNRLSVAAGNTIPPYTSWTKSYSSMASANYITARTRSKAA